jgi:hypothetical protein
MEAPQNKRFYGKIECYSLSPTYLGEKGRILGKLYGLKRGAIGTTFREHVGNKEGMRKKNVPFVDVWGALEYVKEYEFSRLPATYL